MMIEYKCGDILLDESEALVNSVNCVGVMGRGIALQFKNAFPDNFKAYVHACNNNEVKPGLMFVYETGKFTNPRYIINFPTKRHWKGKSRIEDIEAGLQSLIEVIRRYKIQSIAIPPLGSGLGGLNWIDVKTRIESSLQSLTDVHVSIYTPRETHDTEKIVHRKKTPSMTPGRAALIGLMNGYLGGLLDPFVTLLEIHKLMYLMQEAGEPLRLNFKKGPYGPYAENLRHVLHVIEGHFISGYADGGDAPNKQLSLIPGAVEDAQAYLQDHPDTLCRFDQVAKFVEGYESPFGLELLSTVYWIVKNEKEDSLDDVIKLTYDWNEHKRQFTPRQIEIAYHHITDNGWIGQAI